MHDEGGPTDPDPIPGRPPEIIRTAHPQPPRQHRRRRPRTPQADSSARPLRRRAATMARPARVRIRCRKPWVRLRRRLLGWNVRLVTGGLPYLRIAGELGPGPVRYPLNEGAAGRRSRCSQRPSNGTGSRQRGQTERARRRVNACVVLVQSTRHVTSEYSRTACTAAARVASVALRLDLQIWATRAQPVSGQLPSSAAEPPGSAAARSFVHTLWITLWSERLDTNRTTARRGVCRSQAGAVLSREIG